MLSLRRTLIKPSGETSVIKERLMRTSGYKLHGIEMGEECGDVLALRGEVKQRVGGEHAAISFQILLSTGIFRVNVPYVCFTSSPLSVGTNGAAFTSKSPFRAVSDCEK